MEIYPELCFLELSDSRCPANVVCVWEGVAIAKFSFKTNTSQHLLTLATKKFPNLTSTDTTVAGYHIQLLDVTPYPGTTPQPVQAIVRITR